MKRHRHECNSSQNKRRKIEYSKGPPNSSNLYFADSLVDISARVVAANIPFEYIEKFVQRIPEPVQEKIIYFSFPQEENDIYIYSSYSSTDKPADKEKLPYFNGIRLLEGNNVSNVIQIGFYLNGIVRDSSKQSTSKSFQHSGFRVSISFDRCKITSVECECDDKGIFWCQHAVALTLFRIRRPEHVEFRVPISESLTQMTRDQLQKFAQYLIASHPNEVLPSAQKIVDELLLPTSGINQICGAPDPTAGAGVSDINNWHLDEEQIKEQVRYHLSNLACDETSSQLMNMCSKVREMFRVRDTNGPRMLTVITEQFLIDPRLQVFKNRRTEMWQAYRQLWEELSSLWVCVLLNPLINIDKRQTWRQLICSWTNMSVCPTEDWEFEDEDESTENQGTLSSGRHSPFSKKATVFQLALDAGSLSWNNQHLQAILRDEPNPYLCWDEDFPIACMRVHALRCNGFGKEALRLAVAISRSIIRKRSEELNQATQQSPPKSPSPPSPPPTPSSLSGNSWRHNPGNFSVVPAAATIESLSSPTGALTSVGVSTSPRPLSRPASVRRGGGHSLDCPTRSEGWIGLPGDPLYCLVECLLESSRQEDPENQSSKNGNSLNESSQNSSSSHVASSNSSSNGQSNASSSQNTSASAKTQYCHIPIPGMNPPSTSYLCLSLQMAIIGLCQQRSMPVGLHRQEKALSQESRLLSLLGELQQNDSLLNQTLTQTLRQELQTGCSSGLGQQVHTETFPMHATALFLFRRLHTIDGQLAFQVASRAMRLPVLESLSDAEEPTDLSSLMVSRFPRWAVLRTVETRQCDLALAMINAAKDSIQQLDLVMNICDRHIHTAAMLFKLSQEVYSKASGHVYLLCAAFHLALNVSVRTLHRVNWRRREMVSWVVSCAVEVGPTAVLHLVSGWANYTTPREAVHLMAPALLSPTALMVYPPTSQEQIGQAVRHLALQAAMKDPVHCSLPALTLTEKDAAAFESGYKLVCEAAERNAIGPVQLFALAHYLEHRGCIQKAFTLALHAMRLFVLSSLQDSHPVAADVLWACLLAHSLGRSALQEMLCHVVRNVHCPTLLADILQRVTSIPHSNSNPTAVTSVVPNSNSNDAKQLQGTPTCGSLPLDRPPLRLLLDATITAFVSTTHARLANISPRQYGEFLDFLCKARDTFMLMQPDGRDQFRGLIDGMKQSYKGKRKLICLLRERFGY